MSDSEEDFMKQVEERVRKVWHLDPVEFWVRADGRFRCEIKKPPHELTPEEAGKLLRALEPVLERLRRRAREQE